jgi:hypothetical protein
LPLVPSWWENGATAENPSHRSPRLNPRALGGKAGKECCAEAGRRCTGIAGTLSAITTPDKVETRVGTLEFQDGTPGRATLEKVYDHLDFTHAFRAFVDTLQGVSIHAIRKGFHAVGIKDNEVVYWPSCWMPRR